MLNRDVRSQGGGSQGERRPGGLDLMGQEEEVKVEWEKEREKEIDQGAQDVRSKGIGSQWVGVVQRLGVGDAKLAPGEL